MNAKMHPAAQNRAEVKPLLLLEPEGANAVYFIAKCTIKAVLLISAHDA